jgi:HK97 family phage major capsid protein
MASLLEMKRQRASLCDEARELQVKEMMSLGARPSAPLTEVEALRRAEIEAEVESLTAQIEPLEANNSLSSLVRAHGPAAVLLGGDGPDPRSELRAETRTPEYRAALLAFLRTGGKQRDAALFAGADRGEGAIDGVFVPNSERYTRQRAPNGTFPKASAALYEGSLGGSDSAGGYAISVPTDTLIVPLAMPDLGIFDASLVVPTVTDIKIPQAASLGTSTLKSESTGTLATFGGSSPTLGQVTLASFMAGGLRLASWELLQDVKIFEQFIVDDLLKGQRILEGSLLATGTGSSQPQGVFGNTGTGTGSPYEFTGTASSDSLLLLDALFDVTATLQAQYQPNASWIMSRATGLAIKKAQMQANLFAPIATVDADGTERILGRPVYYDVNAPALPTATSSGVVPILFGDFKQGYIIGVRGGAGINVKVLDQPYAVDGQTGLLAYRRIDGRVRRSEAIQAVTISKA